MSSTGSADDDRVTRFYRNTALTTWGSEGILINHPTKHLRLLFIPTAFLSSCGDNSWSYVYKVLDMATVSASSGMVYGSDGTAYPRLSTGEPQPGVYVFKMPDDTDVSISRGPANKRGRYHGAPNLDVSESTVIPSSRSSDDQTNMTIDLISRENSRCLISGAWRTNCVAAHIVPFSRKDVYDEIYGTNRPEMLFDVSAGLLLRYELHRSFDRFEWSLYYGDDGILYPHFFFAADLADRAYHGNPIIPSARFTLADPSSTVDYPDPKLLHWHYMQCVQARLRGYAYDMGINAEGGANI